MNPALQSAHLRRSGYSPRPLLTDVSWCSSPTAGPASWSCPTPRTGYILYYEQSLQRSTVRRVNIPYMKDLSKFKYCNTSLQRENGTVVSSGAALAVSREEEQPWPARPGVVLANTGPYTVTALARVRAYTELVSSVSMLRKDVRCLYLTKITAQQDPVPGWCGVGRGGVWPRPFLTTGWNSASITVNFSRASLPGTSSWCRDPPAIE